MELVPWRWDYGSYTLMMGYPNCWYVGSGIYHGIGLDGWDIETSYLSSVSWVLHCFAHLILISEWREGMVVGHWVGRMVFLNLT